MQATYYALETWSPSTTFHVVNRS